MTHVVAIRTPAKQLNPNRYPISIQPGVVIAVDSRLINENTHTAISDAAQKCLDVGDWCIAAYSGDVSLAEMAIIFSDHACRTNNRLDNYDYALCVLTKHLRMRARELRRKRKDTVVILAGRI